jgi:DUF1680 family protein
MDVQYNVANENIKADVGRVAITRGPFVYCVESMDEEHPPQQLFFHHSHAASPEFTTRKIEDGILQNIIAIGTPAQRVNGESVQDEQVEMIPYYAWNNRGIHPMMVWFPTGHQANEQGGQEN